MYDRFAKSSRLSSHYIADVRIHTLAVDHSDMLWWSQTELCQVLRWSRSAEHLVCSHRQWLFQCCFMAYQFHSEAMRKASPHHRLTLLDTGALLSAHLWPTLNGTRSSSHSPWTAKRQVHDPHLWSCPKSRTWVVQLLDCHVRLVPCRTGGKEYYVSEKERVARNDGPSTIFSLRVQDDDTYRSIVFVNNTLMLIFLSLAEVKQSYYSLYGSTIDVDSYGTSTVHIHHSIQCKLDLSWVWSTVISASSVGYWKVQSPVWSFHRKIALRVASVEMRGRRTLTGLFSKTSALIRGLCNNSQVLHVDSLSLNPTGFIQRSDHYPGYSQFVMICTLNRSPS